MPDTFESKACHSLEWSTELAYYGMERKSPVFRIRGIEHCFSFSRDSIYFYLKLLLIDEASRSRFTSFSVTVYAGLSREGCNYTISIPQAVTFDLDKKYWYIGVSAIESKLDKSFLYCNTMKFLFTFDRADELELPKDRTNDRSVQTSNVMDSGPCLKYLSDDFSKLLAEDANHDVVLKCGGRTIQAHKIVLRVRSSVFAAMLQCDMVEGRTGCVQLQDMDEDTFQAFVSYLYSGTLPELSWSSAVKLYAAGDKYAVVGLKKRCAIFLAENLAPENACECLALADAHNDADLKECVIPYVLDQGVPLLDDQWQPFVREYPVLAAEVLRRSYQLQKQA